MDERKSTNLDYTTLFFLLKYKHYLCIVLVGYPFRTADALNASCAYTGQEGGAIACNSTNSCIASLVLNECYFCD